jgi:hypothetical protein
VGDVHQVLTPDDLLDVADAADVAAVCPDVGAGG